MFNSTKPYIYHVSSHVCISVIKLNNYIRYIKRLTTTNKEKYLYLYCNKNVCIAIHVLGPQLSKLELKHCGVMMAWLLTHCHVGISVCRMTAGQRANLCSWLDGWNRMEILSCCFRIVCCWNLLIVYVWNFLFKVYGLQLTEMTQTI